MDTYLARHTINARPLERFGLNLVRRCTDKRAYVQSTFKVSF